MYWREMLDNTMNAEMKDLMTMIYQLSNVFHKNHYFLLETKRRVVELISRMEGYSKGKVADGYFERKVEYCRDLLEVQSRVSPGLSKLRVYLSNHIATALYWLAKVNTNNLLRHIAKISYCRASMCQKR